MLWLKKENDVFCGLWSEVAVSAVTRRVWTGVGVREGQEGSPAPWPAQAVAPAPAEPSGGEVLPPGSSASTSSFAALPPSL